MLFGAQGERATSDAFQNTREQSLAIIAGLFALRGHVLWSLLDVMPQDHARL